MNLTPEQRAIIDLARATNTSFIIDAKAGAGKSSTLLELLPHLRGTTTLQAFNKAIATELQAKANAKLGMVAMLNVSISTVHSHGLASFRKSGRKPTNTSGKVNFIVKDLCARYDSDDAIHQNRRHIAQLCSLAKSAGFGLQSDGEAFPSIDHMDDWYALVDHYQLDRELVGDFDVAELCDLARDALRESNRREQQVDFDDMIYLPLLRNLNIPQYDNVLLDEAQDINATRRELAFRSIKPGGRLIAVGDPNQAIYGFTGAAHDSLSQIALRISDTQRPIADIPDFGGCPIMPLSICFRCDKAIIASAQSIVPGIQHASWKAQGEVKNIQFLAPQDDSAGQAHDFLDLPRAGDAILCRLNKPNVAVALGLLRRGWRARIEGRDLGKRLLQHVEKACPTYLHTPLDEIKLDLDTYLELESQKLLAKQRESAAAMLKDEVDACQLLIDRCLEHASVAHLATYETLQTLIDSLFADNIPARDTITLASIHKSKGREWPRVFILGHSDYMPFHISVKAGGWQLQQEYNLDYVARTRAEHELIFVHGVQSAIDKGLHREVRRPAPTMKRLDSYQEGPRGDAAQQAFDRNVEHELYDRNLSLD